MQIVDTEGITFPFSFSNKLFGSFVREITCDVLKYQYVTSTDSDQIIRANIIKTEPTFRTGFVPSEMKRFKDDILLLQDCISAFINSRPNRSVTYNIDRYVIVRMIFEYNENTKLMTLTQIVGADTMFDLFMKL